MSVSAERIAAFRADIGGIACQDQQRVLEVKSKDYYWYSQILTEQLDGKLGQIVVLPTTEEQVITVAAAAAKHRIPVTVRGGGTGNYGQCVPMQGGIILDVTKLNRVLEISQGRVICQAGARIEAVETAVAETGQMLTMFPSTKRLATIGGFMSGGSGGIGSLRNGMLRDGGNVSYVRVVTVEETPQVIELRGPDILKVQHAYGTNGIITAMDYALMPAVDWQHTIALFDGYDTALACATDAQEDGIDAYLMTVVERRFARFYKRLEGVFPSDRDAVFAMIAPSDAEAFAAKVAAHGGTVTVSKSLHDLEAAGLPATWECGWNHTTLQALKHERGEWTYLQVAYPRPFDPAIALRQQERYGEELYFHHEMARMDGDIQIFALPILRWTSRARTYEIIDELERLDGCTVFDPHVITIEDGGMKEIDTAQIDFKKRADPHGLMNPGKTRGWTADMAQD
ncbi:FAD-binding oxidoreductase [Salipiger sp. 1_MG-2023]|uniref:FAD-binding oxidoreductase n=1 Tax=Salipiger sp. 1_MG-2023 TaxID=3062665 RepID=UPI0026E19890|nr:FAD-binding oxidoreductase [Salipiger sp. 1_MG-2023]MDO6585733.1 FAD-binding oxidoreductase [Salipiger sp. 1_MG-2023]